MYVSDWRDIGAVVVDSHGATTFGRVGAGCQFIATAGSVRSVAVISAAGIAITLPTINAGPTSMHVLPFAATNAACFGFLRFLGFVYLISSKLCEVFK
jgi:hypothetical protein